MTSKVVILYPEARRQTANVPGLPGARDLVQWVEPATGNMSNAITSTVNNYVHKYAELMGMSAKQAYIRLRKEWKAGKLTIDVYHDDIRIDKHSAGYNFPKFIPFRR